jgi:hypothetical protein
MERWQARFKISNVFLEQPIKLASSIPKAQYRLGRSEDGMIIDVEFDSETSKPPVLQRAMSSVLTKRIIDIITCVVGAKVEAELLYLRPGDKRTQEIFNSMPEPTPLHIKPEPVMISQNELTRIEDIWSKLYTGSILAPINQIIEHHALFTMLTWYAKAKESSFQADKFISLWITFNMIYNYTWTLTSKKPAKHEADKIRNFVAKSNFLSVDQCKKIITGDPYLCYKVMPEYEFLGSKEAWDRAVETKDIKALEKGHEKYINLQRRELGIDPNKLLRNKYGLEFGKFYLMENWLHAMTQVLLFIYGVRNIVFHEGFTPSEHVEGILFSDVEESAFWSSIISVLDAVDRIAICKFFERVKPKP